MSQKKILFLGGAFSQVPAIQYAKDKGCYVITADYLPENPGHRISDEYHNVSTTDREGILELARRLQIDAVSAYASDPAAPTAAYVSEQLKLAGSPYESVELLSNKNRFREFLKANRFDTPWFICGSDFESIARGYNGEKAILKPVDSSGSKGIFTISNYVELEELFESALKESRSGMVILEEFIERKGAQIHGEGFVLNGKPVFLLLGDQHFSASNRLAPYSTLVPAIQHADIMPRVHELLRSAIEKSGFQTGGVNLELIRDLNDRIYILEIGARNGGNFMPQLMKHATGFDLVKANVDALFGESPQTGYTVPARGYYAQIILHTDADGIFKDVQIPAGLSGHVLEKTIYYRPGDPVSRYRSSRDVVGVMIVRLDNAEALELYQKQLELNQWVQLY